MMIGSAMSPSLVADVVPASAFPGPLEAAGDGASDTVKVSVPRRMSVSSDTDVHLIVYAAGPEREPAERHGLVAVLGRRAGSDLGAVGADELEVTLRRIQPLAEAQGDRRRRSGEDSAVGRIGRHELGMRGHRSGREHQQQHGDRQRGNAAGRDGTTQRCAALDAPALGGDAHGRGV